MVVGWWKANNTDRRDMAWSNKGLMEPAVLFKALYLGRRAPADPYRESIGPSAGKPFPDQTLTRHQNGGGQGQHIGLELSAGEKAATGKQDQERSHLDSVAKEQMYNPARMGGGYVR